MPDIKSPEKTTFIAEDDARGALSPKESSPGDTLVPMLVWTLGLTAAGLIVAAMVTLPWA